MTTFLEAAGRQVVSTSTADTVGKVDRLLVDPARRRVVAVAVKKAGLLRWRDLTAFGADAVTVEADLGIESDADVDRFAGKEHDPVGKRVVTSAGDELGKVADVEFDPETGEVTGLVLDLGTLAGARLLGVGSYAVVVEAEQGPHGSASPASA